MCGSSANLKAPNTCAILKPLKNMNTKKMRTISKPTTPPRQRWSLWRKGIAGNPGWASWTDTDCWASDTGGSSSSGLRVLLSVTPQFRLLSVFPCCVCAYAVSPSRSRALYLCLTSRGCIPLKLHSNAPEISNPEQQRLHRPNISHDSLRFSDKQFSIEAMAAKNESTEQNTLKRKKKSFQLFNQQQNVFVPSFVARQQL